MTDVSACEIKLEDRCSLCGLTASHKVGEESTAAREIQGHNLTAYLCCRDFDRVMLAGGRRLHIDLEARG